jgi:hypothetical protein
VYLNLQALDQKSIEAGRRTPGFSFGFKSILLCRPGMQLVGKYPSLLQQSLQVANRVVKLELSVDQQALFIIFIDGKDSIDFPFRKFENFSHINSFLGLSEELVENNLLLYSNYRF